MNINTLQDSLEYVAYSGSTLSGEQCMILQNSLTILQTENHFQQTYFWGKIFGIDNDYFIAFGTTKDVLKERTFYYSTNMFDWGLLPKAKKRAKRLALLCKELFQGDATFRVNVQTVKEYVKEESIAIQPDTTKKTAQYLSATAQPSQEAAAAPSETPSQVAPPPTPMETARSQIEPGTETTQQPSQAEQRSPQVGQPSLIAQTPTEIARPPSPILVSEMLKEEDRLAAIVTLINDEAAMVPRGALFKRADGFVVQNLAFKGLPKEEAKLVNNYYHYRTPQQKWNINLLTQQDYNYSFDFLDTTHTDIPQGCVWMLQFYDAGRISVLQNTYWPGMTCYHRVDTPQYGFLYTGTGKKNMDLPFMVY